MTNHSQPTRDTGEQIFTVSALTRRIKRAVEGVGHVWVEGEISNLRRPSSGHCYFTIKDASAQIQAVLFRGSQRGLRVALRDGIQVRAYGEVTVYERGGNYQIIVRRLVESGVGALQARFEALKAALHKEGLFEADRKQPLPALARHVGVVTSPTGAAIRDILNVLTRRFPNIHLVIAPARVQGGEAAAEIAAGIELLNRRGGLDVMIVGRGGGSLEDLWCFNEEIVARAIAASRIPVISAVGHEIDITISDLAADVRAPTPSAAAELVVGRKDAFEEQLSAARRRLAGALQHRVLVLRNRLLEAGRNRVFQEPRSMVRQTAQRLDALEMRMGRVMEQRTARARQVLDGARTRMVHAVSTRPALLRRELATREAQLKALSPLAVLERGYSVTRDAAGRVLRDTAGLQPGDRVTTRLAHGLFESDVKEVT